MAKKTRLTFTQIPEITLGSNLFINVPIPLLIDRTPVVAVFGNKARGFAARVHIYDADGTLAAVMKGSQVWLAKPHSATPYTRDPRPGITGILKDGKPMFLVRADGPGRIHGAGTLIVPNGHIVQWTEPTKSRTSELVIDEKAITFPRNNVISESCIEGAMVGIHVDAGGGVGIASSVPPDAIDWPQGGLYPAS